MFKHLVRQLTQDGIIAATDAIVNENAEELAGWFVEGLNDPKKQRTPTQACLYACRRLLRKLLTPQLDN